MYPQKLEGAYTSTIGSFPLEDTEENRKRCMEDLLNVGIDFPNYPQLINMGGQFLEDFVKGSRNCNIDRDEKGGYIITGDRIVSPSSPPGVEPFSWTMNYLKKKGVERRVKLRAALTGPFTLASYIKIGRKGVYPFNTALSDIKLIRDLAEAVSLSCRDVASRGASMISIDEPVLGMIVGLRVPFKYGEKEIIEVLNSVRESCGEIITGTHICGRISPKLAEILLKTNLDFLSHEFHDTPINFKVYKLKDVMESGKIISVGCISSKNPQIESVEEILHVMREATKKYGSNMIFTPDCGFKNLYVEGSREKGYIAAIKKLTNLVEAAKRFREMTS
ncbi:TPA: hypothetical protein EYP70_01910 [Candidatus Bathyarchaeota archaeon]|nr:hypothetical protein [Candidatus Bathyarchaeota archaeon]